VPGGIPNRNGTIIDVSLPPYSADTTGSSDAANAIQSAVESARSGDVVFLPEGRYRIGRAITLGPNRDNITVRGAGINATIIDVRGNSAFSIGSGSDYRGDWPSSGNNVNSPLTKGNTQLQLESASAFLPGQIISISFSNQTDTAAIQGGATPTISVAGYGGLRQQKSRVVSKSGNTLTISPGLYFTADAGSSARVTAVQFQTDFSGVEQLTIDGTSGQMIFPVQFEQAFACWVKGVKIIQTANYGVYLTNSLMCEVRELTVSDRKTGGTNGAGVLCGSVGASLFEDNVILNIFPAVEVTFSSMGNVFAYSVMENPVGGTLNTNHGPHNSFNLYEGNITPNIQSDGYFGGASDDTFFRNWLHGTNLARTLRTSRVSLNRFTRNYSLVGNIVGESGATQFTGSPYSFGNPNMGNSMYSGTAKPSSGDFWDDWGATATVSARTSDSAGTILLSKGKLNGGQLAYLVWPGGRTQFVVGSVTGNTISFSGSSGSPIPSVGASVSVFMGPGGYQELDLDVAATTYLLGNYNYGTRSIPADEALGGTVLPPSMFRSEKPAFFGSLPWPAFDPVNPNPSFTSIPAGYRYVNGSATPGVSAGTPPIAPSALLVR